MGESLVLRYGENGEEPREFMKRLVLLYPKIKPTQQLNIIIPRDATEAVKVGEFFSTASPNVSLYFDEKDIKTQTSSRPQSGKPKAIKTTPPPFNILTATQNMLTDQGIRNPFDSGVVFPMDIKIDLKADLGLDKAKLSQLEKHIHSWDFNAHSLSEDELLGVVFVLFKNLLSQADLLDEVKISDQQLLWFLSVCRALYNSHIPYHSYWHSVDVAQLTFALTGAKPEVWQLDPAKRLAIVLAALGHDMKHPGLTVQVVNCVDESFGTRWESLEAYHLDIFNTVLSQLWPCIRAHWSDVVYEAIEATEMSKHQNYLKTSRDEKLSFVHALKISDFASAVRSSDNLYDITSCRVFAEFYFQAIICDSLSDQYIFPKQKVEAKKPTFDSFVSLQLGFLTHVVLPYFRWISERIPWFDKHYETAQAHYSRFLRTDDTTELETLLQETISIS